ncbi:MAG: hypothetical protein U0935_03860 [Pirellulales bacterium]
MPARLAAWCFSVRHRSPQPPRLRRSLPLAAIVLVSLWSCLPSTAQDEQVFSGPQPGEKLSPFRVRGVFDEAAGKELDFVTTAAGKPLVLVFVHDVNRQSIALTRVLTGYTWSRAAEGLHTGVVWLQDDLTDAENMLRRIRHALAPGVPTGISLDGREGPGSYGLNRQVTLTILVAKEGRITANFALVQPSLQVDLPKILAAIVQVAGGEAPALDKLLANPADARMPASDSSESLRALLRPVIRRDASDEEVTRAAQAVEAHVRQQNAARREVGRIATTIVRSGKLADYGTPRAQEFLRKWAREYGEPPAADASPAKPSAPPDPAPVVPPPSPAPPRP